MHQSIDHHHPPPTRTLWRVLDSQAIEQFVYFDIVATVLRQSWLRGKLPLFNQLNVATVWGSRGWGHSSELQTKSQVSAVLGGWRLWLCCCCYWPFGQSIFQVCCFLRNTTILCTISLAISYVLRLFVLIFVQYIC